MTTNYKYPLAISGEVEELKALVPELEKLGYKWSGPGLEPKWPMICTRWCDSSYIMGSGDEEHAKKLRTTLSLTALSPECILAIAAVKEDGEYQAGEYVWVKYTGQHCKGWKSEWGYEGKKILLKIVNHSVKGNHRKYEMFNTITGEEVLFSADGDNDYIVNRPTMKEIIAHYQNTKPQEHNLEEGIVTTDGVYVKWGSDVKWAWGVSDTWRYAGNDYVNTVEKYHTEILKRKHRIFSTADAAIKWVEEQNNKPVTVEPIGWKAGDLANNYGDTNTPYRIVKIDDQYRVILHGETEPECPTYKVEEINDYIADGSWVIVPEEPKVKIPDNSESVYMELKTDRMDALECIKLLIEANQVSKEELYPEAVVEKKVSNWLVTYDGVAISDPEQTVYGVYKDTYQPCEVRAKTVDYSSLIAWWFSTPAARDNYILMNKPCMSYQEIIDWYASYNQDSPMYLNSTDRNDLIELVKQKISKC